MEKPKHITGYTTEKINRDTELYPTKGRLKTKPSGNLLSFSIEKKNKDEKPFKCKYIDYKDFIKQKYGNFTDHVLMMEDGDDFDRLLAKVYNGDILYSYSYSYSKLKERFGGLGNRDEYDEDWDGGSFVIWNYNCIEEDEQDKGKQNQQQENQKQQPLNEVKENLRGGKSQGNSHTILQGQQQNQQPKNQEQKNRKQMISITNQIKTLNTQIQEAINKTQDSQIKNSITEKTRLIGENVDSLISILTGIQSNYILPNIIQDLKIPDEKKKLILGQQLYPKIHEIEPKLSLTIILEITRMILELDNEEILETINNDVLLKEKIDEGKNLISLYQDEI